MPGFSPFRNFRVHVEHSVFKYTFHPLDVEFSFRHNSYLQSKNILSLSRHNRLCNEVMAAFYHTKIQTQPLKKQCKNKLPKFVEIDGNVKDFFPFKIKTEITVSTAVPSSRLSTAPASSVKVTKTESLNNVSTLQSAKNIIFDQTSSALRHTSQTKKVTIKEEPKHQSPTKQLLYKNYDPYYDIFR